MVQPHRSTVTATFRDKYSNRAENFKRPKTREDSSDLDENLSESIATTQTFIWNKFSTGLNIYRCTFFPAADSRSALTSTTFSPHSCDKTPSWAWHRRGCRNQCRHRRRRQQCRRQCRRWSLTIMSSLTSTSTLMSASKSTSTSTPTLMFMSHSNPPHSQKTSQKPGWTSEKPLRNQ